MTSKTKYFVLSNPRQALIAMLTIAAIASSSALAGESCCSSKQGTTGDAVAPSCHSEQPFQRQRGEGMLQPQHGGQMSKRLWNHFEVVFAPRETRVYVYDLYRNPVSARGIEGSAIMRVHSIRQEFRYPLHVVPVTGNQDYLAVRVDLTRVRDGDMDVHFELSNLPNRNEPSARFAQVFRLSQPQPPMAAASSEPRRDERGGRIRVVNDSASQPRIVVAAATDADEAALRRQQSCPVTNQPLGGHGRPLKIVIDRQAVFVCCEGCISTVKQNPGLYLAQRRP